MYYYAYNTVEPWKPLYIIYFAIISSSSSKLLNCSIQSNKGCYIERNAPPPASSLLHSSSKLTVVYHGYRGGFLYTMRRERDNGNLYDRVKGDENDSFKAQFCGGHYNKVIGAAIQTQSSSRQYYYIFFLVLDSIYIIIVWQ